MSDRKPELSLRNPWHLPKHRYYELKHWCMQYPDWKRLLIGGMSDDPVIFVRKTVKAAGRPAEDLAVLRADALRCVEMVERTCKATDGDIWQWLLRGVTEELGFVTLKGLYDLPCERDMYYDRYRKFFWLLSKDKGF